MSPIGSHYEGCPSVLSDNEKSDHYSDRTEITANEKTTRPNQIHRKKIFVPVSAWSQRIKYINSVRCIQQDPFCFLKKIADKFLLCRFKRNYRIETRKKIEMSAR